MEIFDGNDASFILGLSPSEMNAVIVYGEIGFFGSEEEPSFTWSQLERYLSKSEGVSIMAAQQYIAEKVFEKEQMLA